MDDGITIPRWLPPSLAPELDIAARNDAATLAREAAALCAAASPVQHIRTEARRSIMGRVWSWLCN